MGYFSNGTEGEIYEARYCERCLHGNDEIDPETGAPKCCPVWFAHLCFNYNQHAIEPLKQVLELLIPRKGPHNGECAMFLEQPDESLPRFVQRIAAVKKRIALLKAKRDELAEGAETRSRFAPELRAYVGKDTSLATQVRLLRWVLGEIELP